MKSRTKKISERTYTRASLVLVIFMMLVAFNLAVNQANADGDKNKDIEALIKTQQRQIDELKKEVEQLKKDQEITHSYVGDLMMAIAGIEKNFDAHVEEYMNHLKDHHDKSKSK